MGLGTGVVDWLAEQAAKHGLEEGESAALHSIAAKAPEVPFNAPRFVGNSAEDLSQLATAAPKTITPEIPPQYSSLAARELQTPEQALAPLQGKTPNMTPVKEDVAPFSNIPDELPKGNVALTPQMTPLDKQDALTLGGGALGTAGIGGAAAYLGSDNKQQAQMASQPGDAASEYNTMKMLGLFPDDQDNSNEQTDESAKEDEQDEPADGEERPKNSVSTNSKQSGNTPKLSARPSIQELANLISGQSEASKANLEAALKKRDLSQLINQLGKSSEMIGDAFSRQAPKATAAFDQNIALANENLTDYQAKVANESKDPGSAVSQNYRKFLERYGVKVPNNVSAEQVQQVLLPAAEKEQIAKDNIAGRLQAKQLGMAQINAYRQLTQSNKDTARQDKQDKQDRDENDKIMKETNAMTASSRSSIGAAAMAKRRAQNLIDIVNDPAATPQDMALAANELNTVVTNTSTVMGAKHQEYNSLANDLVKASNYLGNNASPADLKLQKAHIANIANRMIGLANNTINGNFKYVVSGHQDFHKRHPEVINNISDALAEQLSSGQAAQSNAPHEGKYPPGSTVRVKDKLYTVGPDGDSLIGAD